ncbi:MAG: endonuclease/exonuclease/phosphatase family protein, partial [Sedimenticola sp.]
MGKHRKQSDTPLSILQWNCRGFKTSKCELINAIENKYISPDVICLQEMPSKSDLAGYKLVMHQSNSYKNSGIGIFARKDIACSEISTKHITTTENILYGGIKVYGKTGNIDIINAYSSPNAKTNFSELYSLISQLGNKSIILGDLNAHDPLWDPNWDHPCKKAEELKQFLENTDYVLLNDGSETYDCSHIANSNKTGTTPDITLATPTLADKAEWKTLETTLGSDHYPIHLNIYAHYHRTSPASIPKWKFHKADWDKFIPQCKGRLEVDATLDINECTDTFTSTLYSISKEHIPQTSGKIHNRPANPWWNDTCTEAIKNRETCRRKWRQAKRGDLENKLKLKNEYILAKAATSATLNTARQQGWQDFISSITLKQNSKEVWYNFNKLRGRKSHTIPPLQNGNYTVVDDQEKANLLTKHYQRASSDDNLNPQFKILKEEYEPEIQAAIESENTLDPKENTDYLNRLFIMSEFKTALRSKKSTSPGSDQIHYTILKKLPAQSQEQLLSLINKSWSEGVLPDTWKEATIIPIL